ncbi:MAG: hypothetical protein ACXU8A_12320, partial [Burkholderiaceae bacterium]
MSVVSTDERVFKQAHIEPAGFSVQWPQLVARQLLHVLPMLVLPAALFGLWLLAVGHRWLPEQILPAPSL